MLRRPPGSCSPSLVLEQLLAFGLPVHVTSPGPWACSWKPIAGFAAMESERAGVRGAPEQSTGQSKYIL